MAVSGTAVATAVACSSEPVEVRAANVTCEYEEACLDDFDDYYDSLEECREEVSENIAEQLDDFEDVSAACRARFVEFLECAADATDARACESSVGEDCQGELGDAYEACEEDFRVSGRLRARIGRR